jgi:hypothetical protein
VIYTTYLKGLKLAIWVSRRHAHWLILWWGRSWAIGSAGGSRVVLRSAPGETDTGVANRVTLHLVDGHLGGVTLDELDEATTLSGGDLDVGDLTEALEERAKLILSDVSGQASNENCGVVGVGELVHWLRSTVITQWWGSTHAVHIRCSHATSHSTRHWHTSRSTSSRLVLRSSGRDSHRAVATINTLHLSESSLLVGLVGKANETVASRHARYRICHDLGRLAGRETSLE